MTIDANPAWPVLTRYDRAHLTRIALPLGGIGTGTVSLGGRGDLRDFEIMNRPAKGFIPAHTFFALRTATGNDDATVRVLEGILPPPYEAARGEFAPNHSLPRFRECAFLAAYPFGQVLLSDPDLPVAVRLEAFNPLIPADPERSGIPIAILRFVLQNQTEQPVTAAICGSLQNIIGCDGTNGAPRDNVNETRRRPSPPASLPTSLHRREEHPPLPSSGDGGLLGPSPSIRRGSAEGRGEGPPPLSGVLLRSTGVDPLDERWGTIALTTTASEVSHRTSWAELNWGDSLLDFWDDFLADGRLDERPAGTSDSPMASLSASLTLAPGAAETVTFLLTWHFPNRHAWGYDPRTEGGVNGYTNERIGNYYTTQYADAWDVAVRTAADLPTLETGPLDFVKTFLASDLPAPVKEAALSNLSTLRTQTCFRTPDGNFFAWEGCNDTTGSCYGSCTHVWNYEQATAFLFGSLARSMREVEFLHATRDDGHMSFRVGLPLTRATAWGLAAADGQMGCLMKLYRDWQLSGDDAWLHRLWPRARRALEFCWQPGGWDADQDGVMEGCQHNTMDVEYYGPNPQMGFWYLGALRAAEEMARYLGEDDFAEQCRQLFTRGSAWLDEHLFNGEYYEQQIWPPAAEAAIAPGLRHQDMGARNLRDPELQLGAGCLVDQLVGQYMARVTGLGDLAAPAKIKTTLNAIMRHNFRDNLYGHFNHLRTFALNDEAALLMASYPRGRRPRRPFPYYNEVMTGFEYTAAAHMLYEGQTADGLKVISAIRDRYDGAKRSPFDEAECGHHYGRALASWAAVLASTGFHYSGVTGTIEFAAAATPSQQFWANGAAWGSCRQTPETNGNRVVLALGGGAVTIRRLVLAGLGELEFPAPVTLRQGETATWLVERGGAAAVEEVNAHRRVDERSEAQRTGRQVSTPMRQGQG